MSTDRFHACMCIQVYIISNCINQSIKSSKRHTSTREATSQRNHTGSKTRDAKRRLCSCYTYPTPPPPPVPLLLGHTDYGYRYLYTKTYDLWWSVWNNTCCRLLRTSHGMRCLRHAGALAWRHGPELWRGATGLCVPVCASCTRVSCVLVPRCESYVHIHICVAMYIYKASCAPYP